MPVGGGALRITAVKLELASFVNDWKALPEAIKSEGAERIALLVSNPRAGKLRFHSLNSYRPTVYTIDLTSSGQRYKASFRLEGSVAVFLRAGTHKEIDRRAE